MSTTEHGNQRNTPINSGTETPGPGDESFEDGILAHLPVLHRVAVRLTRRPYDAEDLVQETVARALAYRTQFHPGTNLRSWLLTIERSIFLNSYRSVRHAPHLQSMDNLDENTLYSASGVSASPSAEHVLLQGWIDDQIADAVRMVPAHYRRAVLLCDVQGLSYIAMATHAATVEAHLSPGVTSRAPHGSKGSRLAPRRGSMTRRLVASLDAHAAIRCQSTWTTNGAGFTCRPSRHNRLPMVLVTVPSCRTTTAASLSNGRGLKPLAQRKPIGLRPIANPKGLGFTGSSHSWRRGW